MAKLRLQLQSTSVLGTYGVVDIYLNDQLLEEDLQLSGDVSTHEYDVTFTDNNTLQVKLINSQAYDANGSGQYDDDEADERMAVTVKKVERSDDGSTYETMLPLEGSEHIVEGKQPFMLNSGIDEFTIWGTDQSIKFDSSGLMPHHDNNLHPLYTKGTLVGDILTYSDGSTFNISEIE